MLKILRAKANYRKIDATLTAALEISPHLVHDVEGTIVEAHRLWDEVNRPNVLIKVPATLEGLPAIRQLYEEAGAQPVGFDWLKHSSSGGGQPYRTSTHESRCDVYRRGCQ